MDVLGIGLAAFGLLNSLVAVFIHVASELTFILNSARLLPSPARGKGSVSPEISGPEKFVGVRGSNSSIPGGCPSN